MAQQVINRSTPNDGLGDGAYTFTGKINDMMVELYARPFILQVAVSDETTDLTGGAAKITFRWPAAFTLTEVRLSLATASDSGGLVQVDVNQSGSTIFSTNPTIDSLERTSTTASTPAVISTSAMTDDAEVTIDIDNAGIGAAGLKVLFLGTYVD